MDNVNFLNVEYLFLVIYEWLTTPFTPPLAGLLALLRPLSTVLILLFAIGTVYALLRLRQIRKAEAEYFHTEALKRQEAATNVFRNERWQRVLDHLTSTNQNDWRVAVMEADIILEDMMNAMGYEGENLGEKLTSVERSDFTSINEAWEAHRVRNQIAHEGGAFDLTERDAKRAIALYETVFKEFHFI